MRAAVRILTASAALVVGGRAADWPQHMGPARDGTAPESVPLAESFPDGEARVAWQRACGAGFAGPVISGGAVILFHREDDTCVVEAMDVRTGKPRWRQAWPTDYRDDFGFDEGPRSAPTVADGAIFCYGAEGTLTALREADGTVLWRRDLAEETGSPQGFFGRCCAPLVAGDLVLLSPGGDGAAAAAFDRRTGALRWKALNHEAGYASPVLLSEGGGRRAVFFTREGVVAVEPDTGRAGPLQRFRSSMEASVNAASPVVLGPRRVFTSACYGTGAAVWELDDKDAFRPVWRHEDRLDCHYSTPVRVDECLVGFHGRQEQGQALRCIAAADGAVRWSVPMAAGHLVRCGRRLVILTEKGELILAAARTDKAPTLTERVSILRGGHRAPPALADGFLAARDGGRLVCVDLRAAPAASGR